MLKNFIKKFKKSVLKNFSMLKILVLKIISPFSYTKIYLHQNYTIFYTKNSVPKMLVSTKFFATILLFYTKIIFFLEKFLEKF